MNNADNTNTTAKAQNTTKSAPSAAAKSEIVKLSTPSSTANSAGEHKASTETKTASAPSANTSKTENKAISEKPANKTTAKNSAKPAKAAKKEDNVVSIRHSASSLREAEMSGVNHAQELQVKMLESSIENAEQLARTADIATRLMGETINISRDHVEAYAEAGNIAAECMSKICEELVAFTNKSITDNVEISKNFFSCRNAADIFELQTRMTQGNIERMLSESSKLTDMIFSMTTKASEPIGERMSDAADRLNKAIK